MDNTNYLENEEDSPIKPVPNRIAAGLVHFFPFLEWIPTYQRAYLPGDIIAGLTVAIMIVPQSMAYALLAGLPPIVGLYTAILPMLVFGLLTSSTILTLGPTAVTSVLTLNAVAELSGGDPNKAVIYAATITLVLGILLLITGLLRLGVLVNLMSQSVLAGHMNAAALVIVLSQIPNLMGVKVQTHNNLELITQPLSQIGLINPATLMIGLTSLGLLIVFREFLGKWLKRWSINGTIIFMITRSGPLIVVIVATLAVIVFHLNSSYNIKTIGAIPSGFPRLAIGQVDFSHPGIIATGAVAIAFVGFMEGISTSNTLAKRKKQRINPNQELIAMGVANLVSFISGGYVCSPSISRSAVNAGAGASTGFSSIVAALVVALVVIFFTPLFYYLPQAALAAIIILSVANLVKPQMVLHFRQYSKGEPIPFIVTFLGAFFISLEIGLLTGIVVSAAIHLYRTLRPPIIRLERIWNTTDYKDAVRYHDQAQHIRSVLIYRPDESLYFANVQYLEQFLRQRLAERPKVKYLILECNAINTMDASAIEVLIDFSEELRENGIELFFAGLKDRVRDRVDRVNFSQRVGEHRFYSSTHDAVLATGELPDETSLPI